MGSTKITVSVLLVLIACSWMIGCNIAPLGTGPQITSVTPGTAHVATSVTLQIAGDNFTQDSQIVWNEQAKPTVFVTPRLLQASLTSSDLATPTTATLYVNSPVAKVRSNTAHVKIVAGLTVTSTTLASAVAKSGYSAALKATGGAQPYKWSAGTALPAGLTLSSGGTLSGTPATAGKFTFTAKVSDQSNPAESTSAPITLTVTPATASIAPLIVATSSLPAAVAGENYSTKLTSSGGLDPNSWSATTAMPVGLTLSSSGTISGMPTVTGSFSIGVRVTDSEPAPQTANATLTLTVAQPRTTTPSSTLSISTSAFGALTVGQSITQKLAATGGVTPYAWSIASGSLPPGLTLSSDGTVSGTPSTAGNYSATIQVHDTEANTQTAQKQFAFSVASANTGGSSGSTGSSGAACTAAPTISNFKAVATSSSSVTVTWTTNCAADSLVFWGNDGDGVDYVWSQPMGGVNLTSNVGTTDLGGTTSHKVTITDLAGGARYWWNARSRAVINGKIDNTKVSIYGAHALQVNTLALNASDPLDFVFKVYGPHHIYHGHSAIISIPMALTAGSGAYEGSKVRSTVSNLPPCMSLKWVYMGALVDSDSGLPNTRTMGDFNSGQMVFQVVDDGTCTVGQTYRLQIDVSSPKYGVTKPPQYWDLTVDPAPHLASGTPASYPQIPCYKLGSTMLDGSSCAYTWEGGIKTWGPVWASSYVGPTNNSGGCLRTGFGGNDSWTEFYDGTRVMYQLYDYDSKNNVTGNPSQFLTAAASCQAQYLNGYLLPNTGGLPAWWTFPEGLYMSYLRNGDATAKSAIQMLLNRSGVGWPGNAVDFRRAREAAYNLQLNIYYQKAYGVDRSAQKALIIDNLLGMIDEIVNNNVYWEEPMFDGLIAEALIKSVEEDGNTDPRIPVALQALADHLWSVWIPGKGWFYNSAEYNMGTGGTDRLLINLIVPVYGWLYKNTGDPKYQVEGDNIFELGQTDLSWMGKEFSQNYRWSGKYIEWRTAP